MEEVKVVLCDMPVRAKGMLVKTFDGEDYYTVVLNSRLSIEQQRKTYEHEVRHMKARDFDEEDAEVDHIENLRHYDII